MFLCSFYAKLTDTVQFQAAIRSFLDPAVRWNGHASTEHEATEPKLVSNFEILK